MQRRAAAAYAGLFLILALGSYLMIAVTSAPAITIEQPDHRVSEGETLQIDGRPYTLATVNRSADQQIKLTWVEGEAEYTQSFANNTTVDATAIQWDGQTGRQTLKLANGTSVVHDGTEYRLVITGETFLLRSGNESLEYTTWEKFRYHQNRTVVTEITTEAVTIAWGDPYRVFIPNTTDPETVTLKQQPNVSRILKSDPLVENQTVTRVDGKQYVVYTANGSTLPVSEYLPTPETVSFSEGDQLSYKGATVSISNITRSSFTVQWTAPRSHTIRFSQGNNVTLNGQRFVVHVPNNQTLLLSSDITGYQEQVRLIDHYQERINGLWGVFILSSIAAIVILAGAYLPSRY